MDRAHTTHSRLSPSSVSSYETAVHLRRSPSPVLPQETPSRQRRLLEHRNARFAGKKISLSDLSNKFTQLIHSNDHAPDEVMTLVGQENMSPSEKYTSNFRPSIRTRRSLGVLEETYNTGRPKSLRKRGSIPVYLDDPERPLLERSPVSSPGYQNMASSETCSPVDLNQMQDSLDSTFSRNAFRIDNNQPLRVTSPSAASLRTLRMRRSTHLNESSGTQEYIEHLEQRLQQAKQETHSPTTNKSLKDQLQKVRAENKQLQQDLTMMSDTLEAELKSSVELRMSVEAELKLKIKGLHVDLDRKDTIIQELKYQHEDRRLENNTVENLKMTLDRLQQDLQAMEDENRRMSKRNEVLSELLAMSPTKTQLSFELRSPIRERRSGRPMSMVIPRLPSSPPLKPSSQPTSSIVSPSIPASSFFNLAHLEEQIPEIPVGSATGSAVMLQEVTTNSGLAVAGIEDDNVSKISDTQSQQASSPAPSILAFPTSPVGTDFVKLPPKRKPRKFMSGSTQLKPLLLPALTSESMTSMSPPEQRSPRSGEVRDFSQDSFDPTTFFLTQPSDLQPMDDSEVAGSPGLEALSNIKTALGCGPPAEGVFARCGPESSDYEQARIFGSHHTAAKSHHLAQPNTEADLFYEPSRGRAISWGEVCRAIEKQTDTHEVSGHPDIELDTPICHGEYPDTPSPTVDITALNKLHLPEVNYDPFPAGDNKTGNQLDINIPQPLFSPVAHSKPQNRRSRLQNFTQLPLLESPLQFVEASGRASSQGDVTVTATRAQHHQAVDQISLQGPCIIQSSGSVVDKAASSSTRASRLSRNASSNARSLMRSRSPLELLQARQLGVRPLAVLTIRTIYGTISRCTSYVRDLKRDPLALARRILANAWFANWSRFGKLAWWVLGIFIPFSDIRKRLSWNLEHYDGEAIAQQICGDDATQPYASNNAATESTVGTADLNAGIDEQNETPVAVAQHDVRESKLGWGKSVLLWGKFSIAIALAVGGAIVKGPGEMMKEMDGRLKSPGSEAPDQKARGRSRGPGPRHQRASSDAEASVHELHRPTLKSEQAPNADQSSSYTRRTQATMLEATRGVGWGELHSRWIQRNNDNSTIRPIIDRRRHVADLFEADTDARSTSFVQMSHHDIIYPEDSVSVIGG